MCYKHGLSKNQKNNNSEYSLGWSVPDEYFCLKTIFRGIKFFEPCPRTTEKQNGCSCIFWELNKTTTFFHQLPNSTSMSLKIKQAKAWGPTTIVKQGSSLDNNFRAWLRRRSIFLIKARLKKF